MNKPTTTQNVDSLLTAEQQVAADQAGQLLEASLAAIHKKKKVARAKAKNQDDDPASDALALEQDELAGEALSTVGATAETTGQPLLLARQDTGTMSDAQTSDSARIIFAIPDAVSHPDLAAAGGNPVASSGGSALGSEQGVGFSDFLLPLIGLGAIGGIALAAGGGGGGDSSESNSTPPAPAAPTLSVASGTTSNQLIFSGTALAGSTVNIYDNGTLIATTTATPNGTYSVSNSTALASGAHTLTATVTTAAGTSTPSNSWSAIIGSASDGPLQGAAIYLDANHNNLVDSGEAQVATTDSNGNFVYITQANAAQLKFVGLLGHEISTGANNSLALSAPAGYNHLNPITTLIAKLIALGNISAAEAEALVENALDLPASDYANTNVGANLAAQKVAAKLAIGAMLPNDTDGSAFFARIAEKILAQRPDNNGEPAVDAFLKDAMNDAGIATGSADRDIHATAYELAAAIIAAATTIEAITEALEDIQRGDLSAAYIAKIAAAAHNNNATATNPSVADYTAAGVSGVNNTNLSAFNDALNSASVIRSSADTALKIQAIVDAYTAILAEANGTAPDATPADPGAAQYTTIGVTGIDNAVKVSLLGDAIGSRTSTAVDSVSKLQALANTINKIMLQAADTPQAISQAELEAIGITSLTPQRVSALLNAIAATDNSGSAVDTLAKIQALIDTTPPAGVTLALVADTGRTGDFITSSNTINISGLEIGATWQYSLNGGSTWLAGNGGNPVTGTTGSFTVADGSYAAGSILLRQTDAAGNASADTPLVHPTTTALLHPQGVAGDFNDDNQQVVTLADGGFVVTWFQYDQNGVEPISHIYTQRYDAQGVAASGPQLLSSTASVSPQITALADGGYVVAWGAADGGKTNIFLQRYAADNTAVGSTQRLDTNPPSIDYSFQKITALADGGYVLVCNGDSNNGELNDIFVQRYAANNATVGGIQRLQSMSSATDDLPLVTALKDGGYVLAWTGDAMNAQGSEVFVQRYAADNTPIGVLSRFGTNGQNDQAPVVTALADGGYVLAWQGGTTDGELADIFVQRFAADNSAVGSTQRLHGMSGKFDHPNITMTALADGGYVLAWNGETDSGEQADMFLQRYAADNSAIGSTQRLHGSSGYYDEHPNITALTGGGYVLTWKGDGPDAGGPDIYMQCYDASNAMVGGTQRVLGSIANATMDGINPDVSALPTGGYVVSWSGALLSRAGAVDVYLQTYDASGNPVARTLPLIIDTTPPATPALALGSGVSNGTSSTEATQGTGVVTVNGEIGSNIVVTFTDGSGHTVTKTVTGTGSAQAVKLSTDDLGTGANKLLDGNISVSAIATDAAGNASPATTTSFTLDTAPPTLLSSTPADNAFFSAADNLTLTFNEAIALGSSGTITLKALDGAADIVIDIAAHTGQLSINGNTLTINPSSDLATGKQYAVQLSAGAIVDSAGNTYAGITDTITLNFATFDSGGGIGLSLIAAGFSGFVINGQAAGEFSGWSVSSAGDVNGDGLGDLIIGAKVSDPVAGTDAGRSYVVFGKADTTAIDLSAIASGSGGFAINGEAASNYSGASVSSAGDVNGDGLADLIIGAWGSAPAGITAAGRSYVVFGKADTTTVDLSAITSGSGGFVINGQASGEISGWSVSSAGDVNGDGLADLIVGAKQSSPATGSAAGRSYVVFGKADTTAINLSAVASGSGGFVINGQAADDQSGWSVSSAGDVNGDGLADLIVGAYMSDPLAGTSAGRSYVVFGKADTTAINLSAVASGNGGFVINGQRGADNSGWSVSSAGDVNGDGLADLIVGAWAGDPLAGSNAGRSYVVFGKADTTAINLAAVNSGTGGFVINGQAADERTGYSVSNAGDVNGDGLADLIIGNDPVAGSSAGRSYVVYGKADTTAINLSAIASGIGGFMINEQTAGGATGRSVSNAGDINGDGLSDLIVEDYLSDPAAGADAGRSYVIFGGTQWVTNAIKGSGTLTGTSADEAIIGGSSADTLTGGGGIDRFMAGDGNDVIVLTTSDVANLSSNTVTGGVLATVNGGGDVDTLRLSGGAALDLTAISNIGASGVEEISRIESIEKIDLATDGAANTLKIKLSDVLDMSGMNIFNDTTLGGSALGALVSKHQVLVDAAAGDVVQIDSSGWTTSSSVVANGHTYDIYNNSLGAAQLLIDHNATVQSVL